MISSPLFIIDALSMVIFAPISHVGCASASVRDAMRMRSIGQVRKGPPDAVSVTARIVSRWALLKTWKTALCSLSTGSSVAPQRAASCMKSGPAHTRHSLLAKASAVPCRTASSVGRNPAAPTMAAMIQSAGMAAASHTASSPTPIEMSGWPARASFNSTAAPGSAMATCEARCRMAWAASSIALVRAVRATTS